MPISKSEAANDYHCGASRKIRKAITKVSIAEKSDRSVTWPGGHSPPAPGQKAYDSERLSLCDQDSEIGVTGVKCYQSTGSSTGSPIRIKLYSYSPGFCPRKTSVPYTVQLNDSTSGSDQPNLLILSQSTPIKLYFQCLKYLFHTPNEQCRRTGFFSV